MHPSHRLLTDDFVFMPLVCCDHMRLRMVERCADSAKSKQERVGFLARGLCLLIRPDIDRRNVLAVPIWKTFREAKLGMMRLVRANECTGGSIIVCRCCDSSQVSCPPKVEWRDVEGWIDAKTTIRLFVVNHIAYYGKPQKGE